MLIDLGCDVGDVIGGFEAWKADGLETGVARGRTTASRATARPTSSGVAPARLGELEVRTGVRHAAESCDASERRERSAVLPGDARARFERTQLAREPRRGDASAEENDVSRSRQRRARHDRAAVAGRAQCVGEVLAGRVVVGDPRIGVGDLDEPVVRDRRPPTSEDRGRERRRRCARRRSATPRRGGRADGDTGTASVRARRPGGSGPVWSAPGTTYGAESGSAFA